MRRPAGPSSDPRDDTGVSGRAATRPVSAGRARAARATRPADDPLARLQALHPTTGAPAGPMVTSPTLPPPSAPVTTPEPVAPTSDRAVPASDDGEPSRRDRARARAHRRGATSEVPTTGVSDDPVEDPVADHAADTAAEAGAGPTSTGAPDHAVDAPPASAEPFRLLGGLDLTADDEVERDTGAHGAGRSRGLVLPVEPVAPAPRLLLPTGRIPRIGQDRPSPVSDLPLTGIDSATREAAPGTVLVPELDPSGEIVRDPVVAERRTLRDRLEPILVRRPRPRVRRVTRVLRHVDTWSVFKVALVFNVVVYVVCLTAGVLLWNVAYTTGTIDNVEQFFEQFGWEHFEFHGGEIYHHAWIAGLFVTVGLTGFAVLLATLFNLITDLVGGIRLSVLEEEVIERVPHRRRTRVARARRTEDDPSPPGGRAIDRATGDVPVIRPDL